MQNPEQSGRRLPNRNVLSNIRNRWILGLGALALLFGCPTIYTLHEFGAKAIVEKTPLYRSGWSYTGDTYTYRESYGISGLVEYQTTETINLTSNKPPVSHTQGFVHE